MAKDTAPKRDPRVTVEGKNFIWATEDGDTLTIPLRISMKTILEMKDVELDNVGMFEMVTAIAPDQTSVIEGMDVNDFQSAYKAWQDEYNGVTGASLGESDSSSS